MISLSKPAFAIGLFLIATLQLNAVSAASFGNPYENMTSEELRQIARTVIDDTYYIDDLVITRADLEIFAATGAPLWAGGIINFEFAENVNAEQRQVFIEACEAWQVNTPIVCRQEWATNHVLVQTHDGDGCGGNAPNISCSRLGMVGGEQLLEIYQGHWGNIGLLQHEIGHALGLIHEHQRSDRDAFVTINFSNVRQGLSGQFRKAERSVNHTNYDYASVMHYNNCDFAESSNCTASSEDLWTIVPVPCERFVVGGDEITQLDLEGINSAYGGPVLSLFQKSRRRECGTQIYSKPQVDAMCGPNCSAAGPVTWSRLFTEYDWGCGWLPALDGPTFCTQRGKEFTNQWWDRDRWNRRCWGGTRVERWTQCGCSIQPVSAMCTDFNSEVDLGQLEKLVNSSNEQERAAGIFAERMIHFAESGYLAQELVSRIPYATLRIFVAATPETVRDILCWIKIEITLRRLKDKDYHLDLNRMQNISQKYGVILL